MFPEDTKSETGTIKKQALAGKKILIIIYIAVVSVCILAIGYLLVITGTLGGSSVSIPSAITEKVKSPIYLPTKLPGNYKIDESSFSLVEDDTVLIFSAKDEVGGNLVFSGQAKPKDFNFDNFHKGNFEDPKTLSDVPYTSVWGTAADGRLALSIVTDDTWLLMATSAPLSQDDMARIASSIQRHN